MRIFRCAKCGTEVPADTAPAKCACGAKGSFSEVNFSHDSKCAHCRGCH